MSRLLQDCVPNWVVKRICHRRCECGYEFKKTDIVQIGVRKDKRASHEVLAIETSCPVCQRGTITSFAQKSSFRELLCTLLEEMQRMDHIEKARKNEKPSSKSKISKEEVLDFKRKIEKMKSYDELLKELNLDKKEKK